MAKCIRLMQVSHASLAACQYKECLRAL